MEFPTITLTESEYRRCFDFSQESARSQQAIEFGQRDTKPRSEREIARDNLIGKMAEVAVVKMLRERFHLHLPINYEVYPRGEWDDSDIKVFGWDVDIKSTRIGHFLLMEESKLRFRYLEKKLPNAIFMCRTPWDRKNDKPQGLDVELIGCISLNSMLCQKKGTFIIHKGAFIPGTGTRLQATNYAVEFDDLSDIYESVQYMRNNPPPDISKLAVSTLSAEFGKSTQIF